MTMFRSWDERQTGHMYKDTPAIVNRRVAIAGNYAIVDSN